MSLKSYFFVLGFFVAFTLKSQLSGDAFVMATNNNWRGKMELRRESRHYKKMRKHERFISRKGGAMAAQRFLMKRHFRKAKKKRERSFRIS